MNQTASSFNKRTRRPFGYRLKQECWCYRPGDVIVDSVSCLLVVDPVTKENAGGCLGQPAGAQHAVTVPLSIAETAFVHLAISIPTQTHGNTQKHKHLPPACLCADQGNQSPGSVILNICIGNEHMCPATLVCPTYTLNINPVLLCMSLRSQEKIVYWLVLAKSMDLAFFPLSLVAVWLVQFFVRYYALSIAGNHMQMPHLITQMLPLNY